MVADADRSFPPIPGASVADAQVLAGVNLAAMRLPKIGRMVTNGERLV